MDNLLKTVDEAVKKNLVNKKERRFDYGDILITMFRYFDDEAPDIRVQWVDDQKMAYVDLLSLAVSVYGYLCDHSLSDHKSNGICITVDKDYFELGFHYYRR